MSSDSLKLRTLEKEDFDALIAIENDAQLWPFSLQTEPYSKEILWEYINAQNRDIYDVGQRRFVISNQDQNVLGFVDLFYFEPTHRRAGVGIVIREPYRNRGFAKRALFLLEELCINQYKMKNLYCNIGIDNHVSVRLFASCGYRRVGVKKAWNFFNGNFHDEYLYQKQL